MPGQIRIMIDKIIREKSHGNQAIAGAIKTKLILKGIRPEVFTATSPDDPAIITKLREFAGNL